jgi:Ca-activated chloride channel homolog
MHSPRVFLTSVFLILILLSTVFSQAEVQLRSVTVTVTNSRGELVGGLPVKNFLITQGKAECQVQTAALADEPLNVGFVVDVSGSMTLSEFREVARPAPIGRTMSSFAELSNPQNKYFLVTFGTKPKLEMDWTSDVKSLATALPVEGRASTALYDALAVATEKIVSGPHRKSLIVVFSDGSDNRSIRSFNQMRELLKRSDVLVYASGIRDVFPRPTERDGRYVLMELTELTGGRTYFPMDQQQMEEMANLMATELRHQYRVSFVCRGVPSPEATPIKVNVEGPENALVQFRKLKVRARKWIL